MNKNVIVNVLCETYWLFTRPKYCLQVLNFSKEGNPWHYILYYKTSLKLVIFIMSIHQCLIENCSAFVMKTAYRIYKGRYLDLSNLLCFKCWTAFMELVLFSCSICKPNFKLHITVRKFRRRIIQFWHKHKKTHISCLYLIKKYRRTSKKLCQTAYDEANPFKGASLKSYWGWMKVQALL